MRQVPMRSTGRWHTLSAALTLIMTACSIPAASETPQPRSSPLPPPDDCFEQLETGHGAEIVCYFPLKLSPVEQAELEKGSRGYVKNVDCLMTIRIARADLDAAITATDLVFQSPQQPVVCSVTTHKSTFDVTATFAPRVVIKGDVATEASPGLGNVKGVTRVISWPVVQFVNRWPSIRQGLLQIVNAYRVHRRKAKPAAVPRP